MHVKQPVSVALYTGFREREGGRERRTEGGREGEKEGEREKRRERGREGGEKEEASHFFMSANVDKTWCKRHI